MSFRVGKAALMIVALTPWLAGCMLPGPVGLEAKHQALALVDQGTMLLRQGDLDQAEAAFRVAYELAGPAAAVDGLGCVAFLKGDLEQAEKYFVQAYQMDESYYESLGNLALLYESQGLYSQAKRVYSLAIQHNPGDYRARNNFAGLLLDIKEDAQRARWELLKARALVDHPLISKNIERVESP